MEPDRQFSLPPFSPDALCFLQKMMSLNRNFFISRHDIYNQPSSILIFLSLSPKVQQLFFLSKTIFPQMLCILSLPVFSGTLLHFFKSLMTTSSTFSSLLYSIFFYISTFKRALLSLLLKISFPVTSSPSRYCHISQCFFLTVSVHRPNCHHNT